MIAMSLRRITSSMPFSPRSVTLVAALRHRPDIVEYTGFTSILVRRLPKAQEWRKDTTRDAVHGIQGTVQPLTERFADTWIVVPAYNESAAIAAVVSELLTTFPNVVVVDDGSTDDTGAVAREAGALVLSHTVNLGQGAALQTGLTFATAARSVLTPDPPSAALAAPPDWSSDDVPLAA